MYPVEGIALVGVNFKIMSAVLFTVEVLNVL